MTAPCYGQGFAWVFHNSTLLCQGSNPLKIPIINHIVISNYMSGIVTLHTEITNYQHIAFHKLGGRIYDFRFKNRTFAADL